jgi:quercetin dioxygenase-like cupin family protein
MSDPQGTVLHFHPVIRLQAVVIASAAAIDGAFVEMEFIAEPGRSMKRHHHPAQEESYHVIDGVLEIFRDGVWHAIPVGASFIIPPMVIHAYRKTLRTPARFRNVHRPAPRFQAHLELLARLIRTGKIRGRKDPESLRESGTNKTFSPYI